MQREGKLESILSWDAERMTVGRGQDCDLVLPIAEVSRHHALFVREGADFEVRDLESSNGTYVNGERVTRRVLAVGDVVQIEIFEFTFVLEEHPIGDEIKTEAPPKPQAQAGIDANQFTQLDEVLDLAPYAVEDPNAPEPIAETATREEPPVATPKWDASEDDLLVSPDEAHALPAVDLAIAPEGAIHLDDAEGDKEEASDLATLEIRVKRDGLAPALRQALEESSDGVLRFEATVVLRGED